MVTIEDVVRTHGAALLNYATRLVNGDRHTAEDVVQETWIRAWRNLDRLTEDHGSVRGWLMRVAHNIAVDQHRRRARSTEVELPEQDLQHTTTQPPGDDEVATRVVVRDILGALTPIHRDTVVAVYYADRTTASAALALGVPPGTVRSRLHNALHTLRTTVTPRALEAA
ncbi:sigma-70 family RNA polymerase sigma factor [Actinophytocola sp.]|uniref:sigma-70 family RNA polymerase sigma factor n=1 Tax=Actinophytocola sp. TaxID=1872138 RepID=UPI002D3BACB4|nr:sigma-70 family RNA polymerase sigma factor [Actinophytocola sp.]HYQ66226.1 sigma-70 family RNA polymerase sigma factor [Actinophytocola sp.]